MDLGLVLTSAVHVPERKAAFEQLKAKLNPERWKAVREETERMPNWQWAQHAWGWAAKQEVAGTVFLQEDIDVAPEVEDRIHAIVAAKPEAIIGLHCAHPGARRAYLDGYRWARTRDGLIGVAYYLPTHHTAAMLEWIDRTLLQRAYERISEDCLVDVYAMCHNLEICHPLPAPIKHRVDMKSTYNNDHHMLRTTQVTWEDEERLGMGAPEYGKSGAAWLGTFYSYLPHHITDIFADKAAAREALERILSLRAPEPKYKRFVNVW